MKKYERTLLNNLQGDTIRDEPLKNVRHAIGSIAYAKGNPLTKTEISLQVDLFFTDNAGNPILPAALPAALQTQIPVWLFGLTDFYSGYLKSSLITSPIPTWFMGANPGIVGYTIGLAPAAGIVVQQGDCLITFWDANPPNFLAFVRIRCNNVAYGTFLNSFVSDLITISVMRYIVPIANIIQLANPVFIGTQSLFGKVTVDSVDPRMYITSRDFQQQISDIPVNLPIDKNLLFTFYMNVFCPALSFVLFVEKVEPLTHKRFR